MGWLWLFLLLAATAGGLWVAGKLRGAALQVTLAALMLLQRTSPGATVSLLIAATIAWAIGGAILLSSTFFYRVLRERGLIAIERLMGMLLVMVSVQMLVNGLKTLLRAPA